MIQKLIELDIKIATSLAFCMGCRYNISRANLKY